MFDFKMAIKKVVNSVGNFFNTSRNSERGTIISDEMSNAVEGWMNLYIGQAPWLAENKQSLNLPAAIASEIARLVTLEMKCDIKAIEGTKSDRSDFLKRQLERFLDAVRIHCEYACAGGGMMFKPYVDGKNIAIDCVQATDFQPLEFNSRGEIISCIFTEHKKKDNAVYHRIEKHECKDGKYIVTNKAYKSMLINDRGTEIALTDVEEWSSLQPEQEIENVESPLFAYFKIPLGNTIDPKSPLGVSVYARAVDLIEDADRQYQRYLWEYEGGELAVEASREIFPMDKKGNAILPAGKERLYRPNELDEQSHEELIKTFSPTLRDASIKSGLNSILQKVEFNVGLAYGTLSDPQTVDKTATEIISSKQRSYSTITDIQKALQNAIENLVYAMNVYATLYNLAPEGEYELSFVWDDSIVVDAETERTRDMNEVRMGLMQKWEYRAKWFGEDEETAKAAVGNEAAQVNPFGLT